MRMHAEWNTERTVLIGALQQERRRFPRVQKTWFVHYARTEVPGTDWMGSVKDLSMGGARFRTEEVLKMSTPLRMTFNLPVPALRLVQGTIVWRHDVRPHVSMSTASHLRP
ncbi:MAG: PilZ domain-containing protein [Candidatus Omnitrophica bacterium]|nr:PilZ domain-containing protein [Candidatus Omnitrophota bacterium]